MNEFLEFKRDQKLLDIETINEKIQKELSKPRTEISLDQLEIDTCKLLETIRDARNYLKRLEHYNL